MKKRTLLWFAALTAILTPLTALTACKDDTSPTLLNSDSEISAILPDADAPYESEISSEISSEYVSEPTPVPKTEQYIRCTGDSVNLRSGAGTGYSILGRAEKNTVYVVLGKTGSWYMTYYRGKIAYIAASYVSIFTL